MGEAIAPPGYATGCYTGKINHKKTIFLYQEKQQSTISDCSFTNRSEIGQVFAIF